MVHDDDNSLRADLKRLRDLRAITNDERELRALDALIDEFEFRLRLRERLCIAVAAVGADGFCLIEANALTKLNCLYGQRASGVTFAISASLIALRDDLAARGADALIDPRPAFAGLLVGKPVQGAGNSYESIAATWLSASSSLHRYTPETLPLAVAGDESESRLLPAPPIERIHGLVFEYVVSRRPGFEEFFREELRASGVKRRSSAAHRVRIDFAGPKLVANFAVLRPQAAAKSAGNIKQRLWDLKVSRDREPSGHLASRRHEMFVQHPPETDAQLTDRQVANMREALHDLEQQADQEELDLLKMTSIEAIGERVLATEVVSHG